MTYPLLRLTSDHARVEVRKGRGAVRWKDMQIIHNGPAKAGQEWKGGEGEKLCGAVGKWPRDADSDLSLPYCISSKEGLGTGKPEVQEFPGFGLSSASMLADAPPSSASVTHRREDLEAALDVYLDALAARDIARCDWAHQVIYTENNVQLALGDGLWNTVDAVQGDYHLTAVDPANGQICWFGHVEEGPDTSVMCLRLALKGGQIAEAEAIICRPHELGPFPQFDPARRPRPILLKDVPEAERVGRERMISLANGYFDTLQLNDGTLFTHFTDDCDRIENGLQTTNTQIEGYPIAAMGCADQFRLGQYKYDDRLRDRRFPLVDEERGLVLAAGFIDHSGKLTDITWTDGSHHKSIFHFPHSFVLLELFKVTGGKIAAVEAVFVTVPYNMVSPWIARQPYIVR